MKYQIDLNDETATIFEGMLANAKCSASEAIANLIITPMAESAGMVEFYNDPKRGSVPAIMLLGDNGELLSGDKLFQAAKLLKIAELTEYKLLAGDNFFTDYPWRTKK